jgi:hypothetical protein
VTLPQLATTAKVAVAWLATVANLDASMAGHTLPEDPSTWPNGFITPYGTGGSSVPDIPLISPVLTLKCWAATPGSQDAPWNAAFNLAELVRAGCFAVATLGRLLTMPSCDQSARVHSAYFVAEPRESYADEGDYAVVIVDMRLHWTAVTN